MSKPSGPPWNKEAPTIAREWIGVRWRIYTTRSRYAKGSCHLPAWRLDIRRWHDGYLLEISYGNHRLIVRRSLKDSYSKIRGYRKHAW